MNIQPVTYSVCSPSFGGGSGSSKKFIDRALQYVMDKIPEVTFKDTGKLRNTLQKADEVLSRPLENRLVMGATALLTQPTIDYYNHRVDDETRTVSRNRTIAKIIAGTLVGMFVVRGPVNKMVEKMTDITGKHRYSRWLLPKEYIEKLKKDKGSLTNYRFTLAMLMALFAMSITNFVLDAPLTIALTNVLNEKSGVSKKNDKSNSNSQGKEGINA